MKNALVVLVVCLGLGVASYFYFFQTSDRAQIKENLNRMSELVAIIPEENALETAGRVRQLRAYFAKDARLRFDLRERPAYEILGDEDLQQRVVQARSYFESLSLDFENVEVEMTEGADEATVVGVATIEGIGQRDSQKFEEASEFKILFKRASEAPFWLITSMENVNPLQL